MSRERRALFWGLGALYLIAVAVIHSIAGLPAGRRGLPYVLDHLVLSTLMVGLLVTGGKEGKAFARASLLLGVAARLLLIGAPSFTSHDVHRYLWDGAAVLHGIDPYRVPPTETAAALGSRWQPLPDNASWPTLYPPAAIALFTFCAWWGEGTGVFVWQGIVCLASLGTLYLAYRLLGRKGRLALFPLVAFSPLLVLEGGVGAHLDLCAVAALVGALEAWERKRSFLAGLCLALGGLLKIFPLLALPPLLLAVRREQKRSLRLAAGTALGLCLGYGIAGAFRLAPLGSLFGFFQTWRFGSPLAFLPALWRGLIFLAGLIVVARRADRPTSDPIALVATILTLVFLTSPVVFPWYLAPLAVLVTFSPSVWLLGWLTVIPLTYEVLDRFDLTGRFEPALWPLVLIALSWCLAFLPVRWLSCYAPVRS